MPPIRKPLQKLRVKDGNERSHRPGPKPKPLAKRVQVVQARLVLRIEWSYTRSRKIQVLMWIKYYRVHNEATNTAMKLRPPTVDEACSFFKIPRSTIARWTLPEVTQKIMLQSGKGSRRDEPATFVCMWPEMEKMLFEAFIVRREQ
ncbi:hypothetical protein HOY80DRAFT_1053436 [Tuber brumale]|nr:hypothetical protein HOY80DRAFT_1053436 [Tuber brumale]